MNVCAAPADDDDDVQLHDLKLQRACTLLRLTHLTRLHESYSNCAVSLILDYLRRLCSCVCGRVWVCVYVCNVCAHTRLLFHSDKHGIIMKTTLCARQTFAYRFESIQSDRQT